MREASKIGREVVAGMPLAKDDKQHTYTADPLVAAIVMRALQAHPRYCEMPHRDRGQESRAAPAQSARMGSPIAPS